MTTYFFEPNPKRAITWLGFIAMDLVLALIMFISSGLSFGVYMFVGLILPWPLMYAAEFIPPHQKRVVIFLHVAALLTLLIVGVLLFKITDLEYQNNLQRLHS